MGLGEWVRIVAAACVGLGGLLLARQREDVLTTDQLGTLIFILAVFYIYRRVAHYFDRRDGAGPDGGGQA